MIVKRHEFSEDVPEVLENIPVTALLVFRLALRSTRPFSFVTSMTIHVVGISFVVFIVIIVILPIVIATIKMMLHVVIPLC